MSKETIPPARAGVNPGDPLRLFVRGFLRDHLGFSKIAAHHMADLFMKRWLANNEATQRRYAREDRHTLVATFDREAVEGADKMTGPDAESLKVDVMKAKHRELPDLEAIKADALAELAELAKRAKAELRFPNKPVFPTVPAMFGGMDPKVIKEMLGEHGLPDVVFVIDTTGLR
jgi:hypothetical protein